MTDLKKTIAELRRVFASKTEHLVLPDEELFSVILRTVASGELIPATERDAAEAVTVKPLVWDDGGSAEFPLRAEGYWIDSPRHDYAVLHANGRLFSNGQNKIVFRGNLACHQAKDAAQADYEARIRAAIGGVE